MKRMFATFQGIHIHHLRRRRGSFVHLYGLIPFGRIKVKASSTSDFNLRYVFWKYGAGNKQICTTNDISENTIEPCPISLRYGGTM
jgi:hypothetical protein